MVSLLWVFIGCGPREDEARLSQTDRTSLEIVDRTIGSGVEARPGRRVSVHYTGWLYHPAREGYKGKKFDSSRDRNEPFGFVLGAGDVIPGWDQGVAGMKTGGHRTLIVPPGLAYGRAGAGGAIPGNATLVFDVELLRVE
jgi:FKBP-type peptidyl-prolyl cis-trans isomerase FkpA